MAFHRIYTTPDLFTPDEKSCIAYYITGIYKDIIPAFYVVVLFIEVDKNSCFVGGQLSDRFVRISVQHLARQFGDDDNKLQFMEAYERVVKPYIFDKGLNWEISIDESDPTAWHQNGIPPPAPKSDAETRWRDSNRALPYSGPSCRDKEFAFRKF